MTPDSCAFLRFSAFWQAWLVARTATVNAGSPKLSQRAWSGHFPGIWTHSSRQLLLSARPSNASCCLPGEEAWLVGEHRASGERKYYLANLPAKADLRTLAATIKARWICEQAHQQLKEELGLDHFEGRSWQGLHRHALMTMIAYASSSIAGSKQQDGKKDSTGYRLSQPCQLCAKPSSNLSLGH
jgi:hypothetical protein